jgi:hypothetical protein
MGIIERLEACGYDPAVTKRLITEDGADYMEAFADAVEQGKANPEDVRERIDAYERYLDIGDKVNDLDPRLAGNRPISVHVYRTMQHPMELDRPVIGPEHAAVMLQKVTTYSDKARKIGCMSFSPEDARKIAAWLTEAADVADALLAEGEAAA